MLEKTIIASLFVKKLFCKMNNYPLLNLFCIFHLAFSGFVRAENNCIINHRVF